MALVPNGVQHALTCPYADDDGGGASFSFFFLPTFAVILFSSTLVVSCPVFLPSCLDTDHIEFHAPLPASLPRRLHQPALGGCVTDGELPHVHFPRNQVHSRHGLSESPGKLMDYIISFPLFKLLEDGRVE